MGSIVSHVLHFSERISLWLTCTALISCIIITIIAMLMLGIGLGYNYCFVDYKSRAKYRFVPGRYKPRPPPPRPYLTYPYYIPTPPPPPRRPTPQPHVPPHHLRVPDVFDRESEEEANLRKPVTMSAEEMAQLADDSSPYDRENSNINELTTYFRDVRADLNKNVPGKVIWSENELIESSTSKPMEIKTTVVNGIVLTEIKKVEISEADKKPDVRPTTKKVRPMVISINGLDLIALLSQLRAENRNYSLQILTS